MKKIALLFCVALVFVACKSKKGSWTSADKEKAQKEVEKFSSSLEILGKNKDLCFKCYLSAIEKKYENNDSASKDVAGRDLILMDCAIKYLHY
jgi:hypothetical protein